MDESPNSTTVLTVPETVYPPREDTHLMINSLMEPVNGRVRALEIGSGSGAVSISLAEMGWYVTAIDVNPVAVAATRANTRHNGGHEVDCIEGSFDEIAALRKGMFDLIVWNLPYIGIPPDPPTLEVMEESSMIDTGSGGWASELRTYLMANPSMLSPDGAVILLYRTHPESPSKPKDWIMDGWATRVLSSLFVGGERLDVVGHWRPGLGDDPIQMVELGSTMDYKFPEKCRFERIFAISQTSGKGRGGKEWVTDSEGIAATWSIGAMNGLSPGILQIGVGAALASSFNMQLKWPNDIVDLECKKSGGVLCKLEESGRVKIGVGMNRYAQDVPGVETAGWNESLPNTIKSAAENIADASVASAVDRHPLVGRPDPEKLRLGAWKAISEVSSRGALAVVDDIEMRVAGIDKNGEIVLLGPSNTRLISDIDDIVWDFLNSTDSITSNGL